MAFNGSGTFALIYNWVTDRNNGIKIQAQRMDDQEQDIADALTLCMTKDGQQTPTANLTMGGFKLTNLGDAASATDAMNRQASDARYLGLAATTAYGLSIVNVADEAAFKLLVNLEIGIDVQAFDATLTSLALLGTAADKLAYTTGVNVWAETGLSAFGRSVIDDADAATARGTFELATVTTDNAVSRYDATAGKTQNSGVIIDDSNNVTGIASVTLPNTGLKVLDTNASHSLTIKPGSDITAARTLTITAGDADRTLNISAADTTISAFAATFLDDTTAAGVLTTLGVSAFVQTLLDDVSQATFRTTLGLGTSAIVDTGTSGTTIPLLDGANTWSGLNIFTTALASPVVFRSSNGGAASGPDVVLDRNSLTPANSDFLGSLIFRGRDDGNNSTDYATIAGQITDTTNGTEDALLQFTTLVAGVDTTQLTLSGSGPALRGTPTNNNAAAGMVGEIISSVVSTSPGVSLTTSTTANVTSITLTPGDWDVSGNVFLVGASGTSMSNRGGALSLASATLPTGAATNEALSFNTITAIVVNAVPQGVSLPTVRVSVAVNTTYYLVAFASFTVSTAVAGGALIARRAR